MECNQCRKGTMVLKAAHLTFQKDGKTLHVENAPVFVCDRCGEKLLEDRVLDDISKAIGSVFSQNVRIDVQE